jgi:hypothetical protein
MQLVVFEHREKRAGHVGPGRTVLNRVSISRDLAANIVCIEQRPEPGHQPSKRLQSTAQLQPEGVSPLDVMALMHGDCPLLAVREHAGRPGPQYTCGQAHDACDKGGHAVHVPRRRTPELALRGETAEQTHEPTVFEQTPRDLCEIQERQATKQRQRRPVEVGVQQHRAPDDREEDEDRDEAVNRSPPRSR